jgi:hypothetical protein
MAIENFNIYCFLVGAKFSPGERYNLTLKASDLGSPPKVSIASLAIVVNEGNEHAPLFDSQEYNAVLSEDLPTGKNSSLYFVADN